MIWLLIISAMGITGACSYALYAVVGAVKNDETDKVILLAMTLFICVVWVVVVSNALWWKL